MAYHKHAKSCLCYRKLGMEDEKKVEKQLAGSDHRPIKLEIDLNFKTKDIQTFPRWNNKKADWNKFTQLSDAYTTLAKSRLLFTILPNPQIALLKEFFTIGMLEYK